MNPLKLLLIKDEEARRIKYEEIKDSESIKIYY